MKIVVKTSDYLEIRENATRMHSRANALGVIRERVDGNPRTRSWQSVNALTAVRERVRGFARTHWEKEVKA